MLTTIIIIAIVAAIAFWAAKTAKQPTAPKFETKFETKEEEPIGYETGSFSPVTEAKPKTKKTAAKPKAPKAPKKPKNA